MSFFHKNQLDVITNHIAWHGKINQFMSELFLHAHRPMSYILWQSDQERNYFFSYVVDTFTIYHQVFFFDPDSFIWKYTCEQIVHQSKDIHEILQSIMQIHFQGGWNPITHASENKIIELLG